MVKITEAQLFEMVGRLNVENQQLKALLAQLQTEYKLLLDEFEASKVTTPKRETKTKE